ncbi:hypothetical protein TB2_018280 [Malus domestica]
MALHLLRTDVTHPASSQTLKHSLRRQTRASDPKKEEQHKATMMINGINQALDQTRQEMKRFKCDADEELQARSRLKQGLLMRRQTL